MSVNPPLHRPEELKRAKSLKLARETERRQSVRFEIRGQAELQTLSVHEPGQPLRDVSLRNISWTGVGFTCAQPLRINAIWRLNLLQNGYITEQQPIIIRHCYEIGEQLYLIGVQFCAAPGLLAALGIDPVQADPFGRPMQDADFVAPDDM